MGKLGPEEIILILLVVLLLFGAKRIPEIGASLGKGIREFKGSLSGKDAHVSGSSPADAADRDALETREEDEKVKPRRLL